MTKSDVWKSLLFSIFATWLTILNKNCKNFVHFSLENYLTYLINKPVLLNNNSERIWSSCKPCHCPKTISWKKRKRIKIQTLSKKLVFTYLSIPASQKILKDKRKSEMNCTFCIYWIGISNKKTIQSEAKKSFCKKEKIGKNFCVHTCCKF